MTEEHTYKDHAFFDVTPDMIAEPDHKGRMPVGSMTDRELLLELVTSVRKIEDTVDSFFGDLKSGRINPMSLLTGMFKG